MRWISMALILTIGGLGLDGGPVRGEPSAQSSAGTDRRTVKPTAPIQILMVPLPRQPGDGPSERRLRVSVTPLVDAQNLEVAVSLSSGTKLVRGETRWRTTARAHAVQTRELSIQLSVSGESQVVTTARLVFRRSLPLARVERLTLDRD